MLQQMLKWVLDEERRNGELLLSYIYIRAQIYHINFLKKWIELSPLVSVFAVFPTGPKERTLMCRRKNLTLSQDQDLMEIVDQFANVFNSTPRQIHLVHSLQDQYPLGVVVRQQLYRVPEAHCQATNEE